MMAGSCCGHHTRFNSLLLFELHGAPCAHRCSRFQSAGTDGLTCTVRGSLQQRSGVVLRFNKDPGTWAFLLATGEANAGLTLVVVRLMPNERADASLC